MRRILYGIAAARRGGEPKMTRSNRCSNFRSPWFISLCLALSVLAISGESLGDSLPTIPECGVGALYNPYLRECSPIRDMSSWPRVADDVPDTQNARESLSHEEAAPPNLDVLRDQEAVRLGLGGESGTPVVVRPHPPTGPSSAAAPVPGGYGAGTRYKPNTLQALWQAVLYTRMFVQVDGVKPSEPLEWLMTPATNHTDSATEFSGIYAGHLEKGHFGVFGRPCTPEYPCPDGDTSNGWQSGYGGLMSEYPCNLTKMVNQGGHWQTVVYYANETVKLDEGNPPLWRSAIYLWNYCSSEWDLHWRHVYREAKRDCSIVGCYKWGPILETWGIQSEINELGFADTVLVHDGQESVLSPDETEFVQPTLPWVLFHLDPNRGYGVGNRFVAALPTEPIGSVLPIDVKPYAVGNVINLKSKGNVWVAILGSGEFDALQVDPASARLGPGEAMATRHKVKDYNLDGNPDLGLLFRIRDLGLSCDDDQVTLSAETFDGVSVIGTDVVHPWHCWKKKDGYGCD